MNMRAVVESVKNYEPVEGLLGPLQVSPAGSITDTMNDLLFGLYERGVEPEKCVFCMSPATHSKLREELVENVLTNGPTSFKGRPVFTAHDVPDSVILFLAPDAVSFGSTLYHPHVIAYAEHDDAGDA